MTAFDLFSIGYSNIPADRFIAMQRAAGVSAIFGPGTNIPAAATEIIGLLRSRHPRG